MYRVLLVDDEPLARMGLRETFDWEGSGYRVVGEASNGRSALPWIERGEVDILITDIAMPVMDGMELMRQVRESFPSVKIILLSCHSDFAYVREGIRMGATDYLLKPTMQPTDLKEVLDKARSQAEEERRIRDLVEHREQVRRREELEKAFARLLLGEGTEESAAVEPPWLASGYRAVVAELDGAARLRSEEGGIYTEILMEELQESFYEEYGGEGIALRVGAEQLILVLKSTDGLERLQAKAAERGCTLTLGVSGPAAGAVDFRRAVREGREAARLRFYEGPGAVRPYRAEPGGGGAPQSGRGAKEPQEALLAALEAQTAGGRAEEAASLLDELAALWSEQRPSPAEVKRQARGLLAALRRPADAGSEAAERIEALQGMESLEEVRLLLQEALRSLQEPGEPAAVPEDAGLHRRIVSQALQYLGANYTRNISLQDVADHVAVSRNYFSELFKKVTGQNFIDHLIHLRLEHACGLLRTTTLRVYEVAELSGFNDVKYFSKAFKKVMKVSPADYREKRPSAGEEGT
ncbi:response regulator [Paenibacillus mucilaginosus]|uniref:YesN10 n=1 Tax=Paenibacillus mucilaginosus (strain KNP414) TaxID=1036673 RepID=F8F828_PAEMK|nr:response regulator [Paenibacillus mucilaginosus]AEI41013.1 YesN10 [Paenibacillus mucilaginosus KNP414]MCG7211542.1 response regulator [Paenibacillus mucilaginosus]WDM30085.1 response regulator [Paenibacillus mucilaginosus]